MIFYMDNVGGGRIQETMEKGKEKDEDEDEGQDLKMSI
jgi:hypothetical protein